MHSWDFINFNQEFGYGILYINIMCEENDRVWNL